MQRTKSGLPLAQRHPDETIGIEEFASHWNKPASSILSDRTRAPWRVPPTCSPEGVRPLRWRVGTVLAFDREQEEKSFAAQREFTAKIAAQAPSRRRGRPNKAEQIRRRAADLRGPRKVGTPVAED